MKKREYAVISAIVLAVLLLTFYLYSFTVTGQTELYLTPMTDDAQGWEIYALEDGKRAVLDTQETWNYPGTVYMERAVEGAWAQQGYTRVRLSSDRFYSVFVDGVLVYTSCPQAGSSQPVKFPSGEMPDFEKIPGFSLPSLKEGQILTVASAAINPEDAGSPCFILTSDAVEEAVTSAWTNRNTMPAVLFAVLSVFLLAVFGYSLIRHQADFGLLLLAGTSLMEMFYCLSLFRDNFLTFWLRPLFLQAFLLLPLLYCALHMRKKRKFFLSLLLISWAVPFAVSALSYVDKAPLWLLNAAPYLMFLPLAALLPLGEQERRSENNVFRLLMPGWYTCLGILALLFFLSSALPGSIPRFGVGSLLAWINDIIRGIVDLLPQPLLYLLNTLLLLLLFFTAALEQIKRSVEQDEELKLLSLKNDLALKSIQTLEQGSQALAVARHDQLHHLRILTDMVRSSPNEAADYAASLIDELSAVPAITFTQNRLVNTILTVQSGAAKARSAAFRAEAILPETLPIPDKDLCAVLMNLLDNAVNAAAQTPAGTERFVSVKLNTETEYLMISIENTLPEGFDLAAFREKINRISDPLRKRHGFGMFSVQTVLSRYGGELRYSVTAGSLTVNTVMSLCEQPNRPDA